MQRRRAPPSTTAGTRARARPAGPSRRAAAGRSCTCTSQPGHGRHRHRQRHRAPTATASPHGRPRVRARGSRRPGSVGGHPASDRRQGLRQQFRRARRRGAAPLRVTPCPPVCDLVLPCRDEAPALRGLLPTLPATFAVIVVDNGSTDDTAEVARALGATRRRARPARVRRGRARRRRGGDRRLRRGDGRRRLVRPRRPGAAARRTVADRAGRPGRRAPAPGRAAACGRGTPAPATRVVLWWLRRRTGLPVHDIAPMRVCRRADAARPRRRGPPLRLPGRAAAARPRGPAGGSPSTTSPTTRAPRAPGPRCPARCAARCAPPATSRGCCREAAGGAGGGQGAGRRAGEDPARRASSGWTRAAELAAAALLDTLAACAAAFGVARCHLALDGDLAGAVRGDELRDALTGWTVHPQRGDGFAAAARRTPTPTRPRPPARPSSRSGMDTPHVTAADLRAVAGLRRTRRRRRARPGRGRRLVGARASTDPRLRARPGRRADVDRADRRRHAAALRPRGRDASRRPTCCATSTPSTTPTRSPRPRPRTRFARAWRDARRDGAAMTRRRPSGAGDRSRAVFAARPAGRAVHGARPDRAGRTALPMTRLGATGRRRRRGAARRTAPGRPSTSAADRAG